MPALSETTTFFPYISSFVEDLPESPKGWVESGTIFELQYLTSGTIVTVTGTEPGFNPGVWTGVVTYNDDLWTAFTPDDTEYLGDGSVAWDEYAAGGGACIIDFSRPDDISINWQTKVISVPRHYLNVIQTSPTQIRELEINAFRLELTALEDDEEGIPFLNTHTHNTEVLLGGIVYARVVEIINGYTVTFEQGHYAVNLVGANSNIGDVINVNLVSVRTANSAGLISNQAIEFSSYENQVTIDLDSEYMGTVFPVGTHKAPVNNLADALLIAQTRGFANFNLLSGLTIESGTDVSNYHFKSDTWVEVTVESGAVVANTDFEKLSLYGEMSGTWNILIDCWVYDITNFSGWMRFGSFASVALAAGIGGEFAGQSFFDDTVPLFPNQSSVLTCNDSTHVAISNFSGLLEIKSVEIGSSVLVGFNTGQLSLDASNTGGTIGIRGMADVEDASAGSVVDDESVTPESVGVQVWKTPVSQETGTFGEVVSKKLLTVAKFLGLK